MSLRFVCLQGHLWTYEECDAHLAQFCPTCGLRLYAERLAPGIPITSQTLFHNPKPKPLSNADIWLLNRHSSIDSAAPAQAIGPSDIEAIPGYELLGILGRGGMGIVFRARQLSLKRQVALKMILTGRRAKPSERARFQREAEAVARLQHPNIVQIYEVGEQNGLPYCALEFVNAGSLHQFLGNQAQPSAVAAQFVHILALAMHYAHKRGIVHRDLKPANILLHMDESLILKEGQVADTMLFRNLLAYVPKISDFGLAKLMGGEEGPHGGVVGTPSYMAPEQARGTSGEVGPAADVYALGAILYEMLTGRPPFKAATIDETAQQVLTLEPTPPTQLQPRVPGDLETICLVCLQKDPAHRYASAEALAEDLRRFLTHEPILARRTRLPERVVKWATRRPLLAALGVAGLALLFLLWHVWWNRTSAFDAEKGQIFLAWQNSEADLHQAMKTIDQLAAAVEVGAKGEHPPPALLDAKQFYESLLRSEGPPARMALVHYRLGKINERLGDQRAAQISYQQAIARWERLAREGPYPAEDMDNWQDGQQRLSALLAQARP